MMSKVSTVAVTAFLSRPIVKHVLSSVFCTLLHFRNIVVVLCEQFLCLSPLYILNKTNGRVIVLVKNISSKICYQSRSYLIQQKYANSLTNTLCFQSFEISNFTLSFINITESQTHIKFLKSLVLQRYRLVGIHHINSNTFLQCALLGECNMR